jgi:hypothetical protein
VFVHAVARVDDARAKMREQVARAGRGVAQDDHVGDIASMFIAVSASVSPF